MKNERTKSMGSLTKSVVFEKYPTYTNRMESSKTNIYFAIESTFLSLLNF
jgi:hypothetical protein